MAVLAGAWLDPERYTHTSAPLAYILCHTTPAPTYGLLATASAHAAALTDEHYQGSLLLTDSLRRDIARSRRQSRDSADTAVSLKSAVLVGRPASFYPLALVEGER